MTNEHKYSRQTLTGRRRRGRARTNRRLNYLIHKRMKLYIGSDHGGLELKHYLMGKFKEGEFIDLGHFDYDKKDDYPEIAHQAAEAILEDAGTLGILICSSGLGMSMAANRHPGIRAAVCLSTKMAKLSRQHNNANILCLGGKFINKGRALRILNKFVKTKFEGGRHQRRVEGIEI